MILFIHILNFLTFRVLRALRGDNPFPILSDGQDALIVESLPAYR